MAITSTEFNTRNEFGDREIVIEYSRTLIDRIRRRPGKVVTLVQESVSTTWYFKGSGQKAGTSLDMIAMSIVEKHRQLTNSSGPYVSSIHCTVIHPHPSCYFENQF